jgi:D-alanine-D-alanine ligase-like ATP-grasp enzyme
MTIDFLPVADAVGLGMASGYAATDASSAVRIAVTAAGASAPLFLVPDQVIAAGAVYSVFVVGEVAAPTGIVRKDR